MFYFTYDGVNDISWIEVLKTNWEIGKKKVCHEVSSCLILDCWWGMCYVLSAYWWFIASCMNRWHFILILVFTRWIYGRYVCPCVFANKMNSSYLLIFLSTVDETNNKWSSSTIFWVQPFTWTFIQHNGEKIVSFLWQFIIY